MDESLINKVVYTKINSSTYGEKVLLRNSLIDNFLGFWDEVGIELLNEEEKKVTNAIWFNRKDIPDLIVELQKFVDEVGK